MFKPQPLRAQAIAIIKTAIINGELNENEPITERLLFERYQISKTPLREALQTLEAEGWVQKIPYKGTYVTPITIKDIQDIFELRLILESAVIKQLEDNPDSAVLNKLGEAVEEMQSKLISLSDYEFILLDESFHKIMYQYSNNRRMISIFEQLRDSIRRIGIKTLYHKPRREDILREHIRILEGIKKEKGVEELKEHFQNQMQTFISLMEQADREEEDK